MTFLQQMRASKAFGAKDYDIAIEAFHNILKANQSNSFALSMLAICHELKGNRDEAFHFANKQLALDPTDYDMLLLVARYWSKSNDEDKTYHYVCCALENIPTSTAEIPSWVYLLLKPLSLTRKFRGLEARSKANNLKHDKNENDNLDWARQYKAWYEDKRH